MRIIRLGSTLAAVTVFALAGVTVPVAHASAAGFTVGTLADLEVALADCTSAPTSIQLSADITAPASNLLVGCDTVLELSNFELSVNAVTVQSGSVLEVTGVNGSEGGTLRVNPVEAEAAGIGISGATLEVHSGNVIATSLGKAAAIGANVGAPGMKVDGGALIVNGGSVHATAYAQGAGAAIGGGEKIDDGWGFAGGGGTVTVTGGSLTAVANSPYGVGIGGGGATGSAGSGDGATVSVTGGSLRVETNGQYSNGIGGGAYASGMKYLGSGGSLAIGAGASVTIASVSPTARAFGGGRNATYDLAGSFGTIDVAGVLRLTGGFMKVPNEGKPEAEVTVATTGEILGTVADPTVGTALAVTGRIANYGAIALDQSIAGVAGNNYQVSFDADAASIRVFAPSVAAGYRTLPSAPAGMAWNIMQNGPGEWFTPATVLASNVSLFARSPGSVSVSADPAQLTAVSGQPFVYPVTVLDWQGEAFAQQPEVSYSSSDCTLPVDGVFTVADVCTVTATTVVEGVTLSQEFTVQVVAGEPTEIRVAAPAGGIQQGDTIIFDVIAHDAAGNMVDTTAAVLTSSVSTDIIDGHSVTFPTASPHVITATLGEVSGSFTVQVIPASTAGAPPHEALSDTGTPLGVEWLVFAAVVLLFASGSAFLFRTRLRIS